MPQFVGYYAKATRSFDNNNPREFLNNLVPGSKQARANAAMINGYEGLPLFAAAVIISHLLQAEQSTINFLAVTYIISRIIFSVLYIMGFGAWRSLAWLLGLICIISLFIISA